MAHHFHSFSRRTFLGSMAAGSLAGVRDFIHVDLGFWPLNPWPTFNIADAGITGGFLVLAALSLAKPKPGPTPGARVVV